MIICQQCRRPLPEDARFCPACGSPQATPATPADERRVATVVIGDLVNFTSLAETLDPERVKELVEVLFGRLAHDVTGHGGTVDKVVGDQMVALFGAPVAHGDDAERAVRAALRMQETVSRVSQEQQVDLAMRIGVNTGEMLVGGLTADASYTAMGDAVNVAARLEEAADPGTVLVGAETREATAHAIGYVDARQVSVRGRAEAVSASIATTAIGRPGASRYTGSHPSVGRASESRLLDAILDTAMAQHRAHLVEIHGDAGVGKRHLAEAFARRAQATHNALVLSAHVPPYGEASMWQPAADMLRSATDLDLADPDELRALVGGLLEADPTDPSVHRVAAALGQLVDGGPGALAGEATTQSVVRAIARLVAQATSDRPVVTVLTNMQWADQALIELMSQVLIELRRQPVVTVTTGRDLEAPEDLVRILHDTVNVTTLRLTPLDDRAADELARALLPPDADDATIAAAVRRSGGNPLVLEEIAVLAASSQPAALDVMPMTLRGLVSARLDALPQDQRRLVEDAAMIGFTGDLQLLTDLASARGEQQAARLAEALVDAEVFALNDGAYRFKTDALREAAYLRLPKGQRITRHREIGRRLAPGARAGSGSALRRRAQHLATAAELAESFGQPDDELRREAVAALRDAAVWAASRDPQVAVRYIDQALPLTEAPEADLLLLRAEALVSMGRYDEGIRQAIGARDAGLGADREAAALIAIGRAEQALGRLARAEETLTRAVVAARRAEDLASTALALRMVGLTRIFAGDDEGAHAAVSESGEVSAAMGDVAGRAWADQHLGWIAMNRGDMQTARRLAERAQAGFDSDEDPMGQAFTTGLVGWLAFMEGDLDAAGALAQQAAAVQLPGEAGGFGAGISQALLASVALWQGRTSAALAHADEADSAMASIGHHWGRMLVHLVRGRALAHLGRPLDAERELTTGAEMAVTLGPTSQALAALTAAAVAVHLGSPDRALELLEGESGSMIGPDAGRLRMIATLQRGEVTSAAGQVEHLLGSDVPAGTAIANQAAAAFVLACAGDPAALPLADAVDAAEVGTFQDRVMAGLARAVVATDQGDTGATAAALTRCERLLADVEDAPTRQLARLARSRLLEDPEETPRPGGEPPSGMTGDGWWVALGRAGAGAA